MILSVPSLREDGPIRAIIDMETFKVPTGRLKALGNHEDEQVIGYWSAVSASAAGIDGDLNVIIPRDDREAAVLEDAIRAKALIDAGIPMEASIGAMPGEGGSWERCAAGSIRLNEREYIVPDDDIPTFILRGGTAFESSIVTFGADSRTGRIAASKHKEVPMADKITLDAILAKHDQKRHGLIARVYAKHEGKPEAIEPAIDAAIRAADTDEMNARITALETENADLKAKLQARFADDDADDAKKDEKKPDDDAKARAGGSQRGVSFTASEQKGSDQKLTQLQAMQKVRQSDPKLSGLALIQATRLAYPNATA